MSLFDMETEIVDIPHSINRELINELSENSSWNIIVRYFVDKFDFKISWAETLERESRLTNSKQAAKLLMQELIMRKCTVGILCRILRECKILYALYLFQGHEPLVIDEQPQSNQNKKLNQVALGETFTLRCNAVGVPPPRYQWFHDNVKLPDQNTSDLNLPVTSPDQEGDYRCRVRQYNRDGELLDERYSESAFLKIKPVPVVILKDPLPVEIIEGGNFVLNCEAVGYPAPCYQWFKDENKLENKRSNTLCRKNVRMKHAGRYFCHVTNGASYAVSRTIKVTVLPPPEKASAKIALLIGNSDYENGEKLSKPLKDVIAIEEQLTKIGFHVICLANATRFQMKKAIEIFSSALTPGVYGFFYFAGHGLWMHDSRMLPIDAPESPLQQDTILVTEFLELALKSDPSFLVVILDMCLRVPDEESNKKIYEEQPKLIKYKNNENFIIAHSTSNFGVSLEGQKAENGIYASQLIKHIPSKKPAITVFQEVAEAVARLKKGGNTQTPQIYNVMTKPYRLTDAIDDSESLDPIVESVKEMTTFKPSFFEVQFEIGGNLYKRNITIRPMNPPFLSGLRIIISDVENLHVTFLRYDYPSQYNEACLYELYENQTDISYRGGECHIYNPELHNPEARLLVLISVEGCQPSVHMNIPYTNHIPEILKRLNQQ